MFRIISAKRYKTLLIKESILNLKMKAEETEDEITYHCGYKSCQFQTTDAKGLKIHRARIHKNK